MSEKETPSKNENLSELIRGLINERKFISRELSWIGSTENYFFKIPKKSEHLTADMHNPEALKLAREERHCILKSILRLNGYRLKSMLEARTPKTIRVFWKKGLNIIGKMLGIVP